MEKDFSTRCAVTIFAPKINVRLHDLTEVFLTIPPVNLKPDFLLLHNLPNVHACDAREDEQNVAAGFKK